METKILPTAKLIAVPIEVLAQPREGDTLIDRWWVSTPEGVLFYQHPTNRGWTPQCNRMERATRLIQENVYPEADITFVPVAYLGAWDLDWGHLLTSIPEDVRTVIQ